MDLAVAPKCCAFYGFLYESLNHSTLRQSCCHLRGIWRCNESLKLLTSDPVTNITDITGSVSYLNSGLDLCLRLNSCNLHQLCMSDVAAAYDAFDLCGDEQLMFHSRTSRQARNASKKTYATISNKVTVTASLLGI
jgi:hypothetical protein